VDGVLVEDLDLDGVAEVALVTPGQIVTLKPSEGAGIGSWDVRAARHALTAVMRRRPEASHETLVEHERRLAARGSSTVRASAVGSIHDMVATKEAGLTDLLHYDQYERRSGLVRILAPDTTPDAFARAVAVELGDFVTGEFLVDETAWAAGTARVRLVRDGTARTPDGDLPIRVAKTVIAGADRRQPALTLEVRVENRSEASLTATLGVEWAFTMLGGGRNPAAYFLLGGARLPFDSASSRAGVTGLHFGNSSIGIDVATRVEPPADAWISPIETVSNSEAGFERVHQGSALVFAWPISLPPGGSLTVRVENVASTARDRADEEAAAPAR
jgi:alpha-amylase